MLSHISKVPFRFHAIIHVYLSEKQRLLNEKPTKNSSVSLNLLLFSIIGMCVCNFPYFYTLKNPEEVYYELSFHSDYVNGILTSFWSMYTLNGQYLQCPNITSTPIQSLFTLSEAVGKCRILHCNIFGVLFTTYCQYFFILHDYPLIIVQ